MRSLRQHNSTRAHFNLSSRLQSASRRSSWNPQSVRVVSGNAPQSLWSTVQVLTMTPRTYHVAPPAHNRATTRRPRTPRAR
eukprot:7183537-Pyramimonas_sp.AAC.1